MNTDKTHQEVSVFESEAGQSNINPTLPQWDSVPQNKHYSGKIISARGAQLMFLYAIGVPIANNTDGAGQVNMQV